MLDVFDQSGGIRPCKCGCTPEHITSLMTPHHEIACLVCCIGVSAPNYGEVLRMWNLVSSTAGNAESAKPVSVQEG